METDHNTYVPGERLSRWPAFWGVIAIVFGILGLLSAAANTLQAGMMLVMPMEELYGNMEEYKTGDQGMDKQFEKMLAMQEETMAKTQELAPYNLAISILSCLLAGVLLAGGIFLMGRKRVASSVLQSWAWLKILIGGAGVWVNYKITAPLMNQVGSFLDGSITSSGSSSSGMPDMGMIMGLISQGSFFIGMLWVMWLPVFFLVWFNRENVKEEMTAGPGW